MQLRVELADDFPTAHALQSVAPGAASVLVSLPPLHTAHDACPAKAAYLPAAHSAQLRVESAVERPVAHAVQLRAPALVSVSVYEPAGQGSQLVTRAMASENVPIRHAVQDVCSCSAANFPMGQSAQPLLLSTSYEYRPAAQSVSAVAPAAPSPAPAETA